MFLDFFYMLRARGLDVSLNEWMMLMEAVDKGLCHSGLMNFYHLCRSILIKSETDYDKFDAAFAEYFKDVHTPEDLPEDFWKWLGKDPRQRTDKPELDAFRYELDELLHMFKERIEEQKSKHDGGSYWIGTGGKSTMGTGGTNVAGIRTGGAGRLRSAVMVAGERNFRDFREDEVLDLRQFQMAFRKLRQYSSRVDSQKTELDIHGTVDKTCENAGRLQIVYEKPRKNTIKLLLLFDSDGSMMMYSQLCARLFQAVSKSSHFKDLKVYYFHNCVYDQLFRTPHCKKGDWVMTDWLFRTLGQDYKVIFVGDASMAPAELFNIGNHAIVGLINKEPGYDWMKRFKKRYKKIIWLNPLRADTWDTCYGAETVSAIRQLFPMYELTLEGIDAGIKKLLTK